jgi:hypothetical protein
MHRQKAGQEESQGGEGAEHEMLKCGHGWVLVVQDRADGTCEPRKCSVEGWIVWEHIVDLSGPLLLHKGTSAPRRPTPA